MPTMLHLARAAQRGESFSREFNAGVVALLPKVEVDTLAAGQYRPITLLNLDYKIIAGVVSGRSKKKVQRVKQRLEACMTWIKGADANSAAVA